MKNLTRGTQALASALVRRARMSLLARVISCRQLPLGILGAGLLCLTTLCGCATALTRSEQCGTDVSPTPYRATLFDLGAIPMTAAGCKEDPVLAVLYPLGCLVDLPFSLVADTVCLPFDLVKLASKKKP